MPPVYETTHWFLLPYFRFRRMSTVYNGYMNNSVGEGILYVTTEHEQPKLLPNTLTWIPSHFNKSCALVSDKRLFSSFLTNGKDKKETTDWTWGSLRWLKVCSWSLSTMNGSENCNRHIPNYERLLPVSPFHVKYAATPGKE